MPLLEALNGYKLKLPSELEDEEEESSPAADGEEEEQVGEGEEEGGRLANGTVGVATTSLR